MPRGMESTEVLDFYTNHFGADRVVFAGASEGADVVCHAVRTRAKAGLYPKPSLWRACA